MALAGSDTVRLVFRDPVLDGDDPTFGDDGRPVFADRLVEKTGVKFTIEPSRRDDSDGSIPPTSVYQAKAALPVDADTIALTKKDAVEHDGKVYELTADARVKRTLIDGVPHHVRIVCRREESAATIEERVTITPRGGQDDDGHRLPDGQPFTVTALAVDPGNTAERYGRVGTTEEADFTVVLPLGIGVRDGDWVTVRGRVGTARVQRLFSEHTELNQDVLLVRSRTGGG